MQYTIRYLKRILKVPRALLAKYIRTRSKEFNELGDIMSKLSSSGLVVQNPSAWKTGFKRFVLAQSSGYEIAEAFYQYPPEIIRELPFENNKPILIVPVKNELYRMKKFLNHYRKIGVDQFAIIDNDSTDGTKEYLLEQPDVSLFSITVPYTTNRREAWINRIIAYYGFGRWYIIVDSDELLLYEGAETHSIQTLIQYATNQGIKRVRGMLIDMYPERLEFNSNGDDNDQYSKYSYFDSDTYSIEKGTRLEKVLGGFRYRIFNTNNLLTKYPIVYFEKGDIQGNSHYEFPYKYNFNTPCLVGLCHYKFLTGEMEKLRENAYSGNYYGGSIEYKQYVTVIDDHKGILYPTYSGSIKLTSSSDLRKTKIIESIKWDY